MRPKPAPCKPTEVPDAVRVKLISLIDEFRGSALPGAYSLGPFLCESLGMKSLGTGDMHMIRRLVYEIEWWEFYDSCEALVRISKTSKELIERIEAIFAEENLPYAMTPNGIVWRFSQPAAAAINEATRLLVEDESLRGPAEQWQKALGHLSERPPDAQNCIKDAVGALEGTGRILSGRDVETLSKLIVPFSKEIGMHPTLATVADKLYAYRGDEQAVAHGAIRELGGLAAEAELVLHLSAATIVYFVKKRSVLG